MIFFIESGSVVQTEKRDEGSFSKFDLKVEISLNGQKLAKSLIVKIPNMKSNMSFREFPDIFFYVYKIVFLWRKRRDINRKKCVFA